MDYMTAEDLYLWAKERGLENYLFSRSTATVNFAILSIQS